MKRVLITGGMGYIGSALAKHLMRRDDYKFGDVWVSDINLDGIRPGPAITNEPGDGDYRNEHPDLPYSSFDVVIHLAAHSSVKACQDDPQGAWANNVTGFAGLLQRLTPDQRLIYASSGSVYNRLPGFSHEDTRLGPPTALYDLTKATMDQFAGLSNLDYYGLRFGTVCGASPNMRRELMINQMARSAYETNWISVANPQARRAILGIDDLCKTIEAIIDSHDRRPGIYNVASFNSTVGDISREVAAYYGAGRCFLPSSPCYDFAMSNHKAAEAFGYWPVATTESIVRQLAEQFYAGGVL